MKSLSLQTYLKLMRTKILGGLDEDALYWAAQSWSEQPAAAHT